MLRAVEPFLLPPLLPLVLALLFLGLRRKRRKLGNAGLVVATLLLVAGNLPIVGVALLRTLQTAPPLDLAQLPKHATSMQRALETELGVRVRWLESRSTTTAENARYSAELLRGSGIERVLLVTHAWHMPRAQASFQRHGIATTAAPTAFACWPTDPLVVALALHEWLGRAYYALVE
jgi:uncharacterized SAM-binding protein YcdF (DUF218 family)